MHFFRKNSGSPVWRAAVSIVVIILRTKPEDQVDAAGTVPDKGFLLHQIPDAVVGIFDGEHGFFINGDAPSHRRG